VELPRFENNGPLETGLDIDVILRARPGCLTRKPSDVMTLMKNPEEVGRSPNGRGCVVAGWCAILAVPLILVRITQAVMDGQLAEAIRTGVTNPATWLSSQGVDRLALMLIAPIALLSLVGGIAMLRLKRWAWVALMAFLVLALLLNLVRSYFQQPEYGLMLIYAVLVLILNQPDVRQASAGRPTHDTVE
jgi:MFS-type transporter involved in bile tolerance (Atg22 family)